MTGNISDSAASDQSSHGTDSSSGVGLSDPRLSDHRRRIFELIRRLRNIGVDAHIDIPIIAAVGRQSAGKSSLIEAISGISLPRASGTCTRCPTEVNLYTANDAWNCQVSLRVSRNSTVREVAFGPPIIDRSEVTERIRRAQKAILNILSPDDNLDSFLHGDEADMGDPSRTFSSDCIVLKIAGRDVTNLMFVDLPGLIPGGDNEDATFVDTLVDDHVKRKNCIMLVTVPGEADFKIQTAHRVALKHDKTGERTIGVLTKPDRIPTGEEGDWTGLVMGTDSSAGDAQWFVVKYPDSAALQQGITWEESRVREMQFFTVHPVWSRLDNQYKNRLGTAHLTSKLSDVLSELIIRKLPDILAKLESEIEKTKTQLNQMPPPPSKDPISEVVRMVSGFVHEAERQTQGVPGKDGLLQNIRGFEDDFQLAIRKTVPDFRPYNRDEPMPPSMPLPDFLNREEDSITLEPQMPSNEPIFIDDVMDQAHWAVTRELPDNYPFVVQKQAILKFIDKWGEPSHTLFKRVETLLTTHLLRIINKHFERYALGGFKQKMIEIASSHIRNCAVETLSRIDFLLQVEHEPKTRNLHYFRDYHSKFMTFYRGIYRRDSTVAKRLFEMEESEKIPGPVARGATLASVKQSLLQLGFRDMQTRDLLSLLPPDPMDAAIHIMADVRAYFQVAYKRFIDNVPCTIDEAFVRGVVVDMQSVILSKLGIDGPNGFANCSKLLQEPKDIARRRHELRTKLEKLEEALQEVRAYA